MYKKLFFAAICCCFSILASAQYYVTLYEDCNYSGKKYYLEAGTYRLYQMKIDNDLLSCMQIPSGMKVTIYADDNFKGKSKTFFTNVTCLDGEWNDMASSIVVENTNTYQPNYNQNDYVVFYNDCYANGYSMSLRPGRYYGSQLGNLKYNISSFTIYGNLVVKTYVNNESLSGYSYTHEASENCLSGSENDKIGSLVIEYRQNNTYNPYNPNSGSYVTIYTDCYYRGNSLRLTPGHYQGNKLGLLRYDISSIEIPSNLKAKVFIHNDQLSGTYYNITESSACLSSSFNDHIGSLIIEENSGYNNNPPNYNEAVVIYEDANYKGRSASLLPGTYATMAQAGFIDNALSSLTVPAGYRVILYEYENFGGKPYTITQSKPGFILSNWNDRASSIAVYRDR